MKLNINNKNKKIYATTISIIVFIVCIIGFTYAYFALTASDDNTVTGTVGGANIGLTVEKLFPNNTKKMIPQLESALDKAISEERSCIDGNGNNICQVYEIIVTNINNKTRLTGSIKFDNLSNIENLKWKKINDSRTIGEYPSHKATTSEVVFEEAKTLEPNEIAKFYIVIWLDEIGSIQTDEGDFSATIKFESIDGGLTSSVVVGNNQTLLTDHIVTLYNSNPSTNYYISGEQFDSEGNENQTVSLNSEQKLMKVDQGPTYGVEYRYYGATPNNYVEYNGELWRIISSSKVFSSESDTTGETRVRIIKDTKIGDHSWDYNYSNNWTTSTLNTALNGIYYNRTSGTCYLGEYDDDFNYISSTCDYSNNGTIKGLNEEARSLIDNALWYLGGNDTSDIYADDYYTMERNNSGYGSNLTRWTGKIGIMYPSDYAYAANLNKCTKTGYYYYTDTTNCTGTDWLYIEDNSQWLISPGFDISSYAWYVDGLGLVSYGLDESVSSSFAVRPLVVLKSNVTITGGSGTSGEPYQLALNE